MREIKFRGKRIDNGEWAYGSLWQNLTITEEPVSIITEWKMVDGVNTALEHVVISETVGQFTSLKDKNGKEIYEGGVLETNGVDGKCLWLIEYEYSGGMIGFSPNCISGQYSSVHNEVWDEEIEYTKGEIIGNITDNPKLLEDK